MAEVDDIAEKLNTIFPRSWERLAELVSVDDLVLLASTYQVTKLRLEEGIELTKARKDEPWPK